MTEPQATLRSLGILKSDGINYLSSASMRMANEESGMSEYNLEQFLQDGGFPFLPQSWQGSVAEEPELSAFHSFVLDTLKKTETQLEKINVLALIVYLIIALLWEVLRRRSSAGSFLLRRLFWVAIMYGLVVLISWKVVRTVEETCWAKGIRSRKAYTLPWIEPIQPRPGTIPHRTDILLVPHYASNYMASYSHVIDVAHPGNKFWNDLVREQAGGYAALPPALQRRFCETLLESTTSQRRFLAQGLDRLWYNVTDHKQLTSFCHTEFIKASNPLQDALSFEIDSLKCDSEFGMFRMTGMDTTHIPDLLRQWEERILPPLESGPKPKSSDVTRTILTTKDVFRPFSSLLSVQAKTMRRKTSRDRRLRSLLPPKPTPKPPTQNAWLQDGDRVMAKQGCYPDGKNLDNSVIECSSGASHGSFHTSSLIPVCSLMSLFLFRPGEYFPGVIVASFPNVAAYDIEYDDGETEEELMQHCVLPETF